MRRRNIDSANASISLFPFLAVLICTMGVMIILLVVAHRAGQVNDEKTDALVRQEWSEQKEQLDFELQSKELKIRVLMGSRPELQDRLEQARLRRSHVENELRELEKGFNEAVARARLLSSPSADRAEIEEPDLQLLKSQIDEAERNLESELADREANPSSYAIVTHPTIHGTLRRPIYVECAATTITLQPSGVEIQTVELIPPILPGNPLDTALLAIREYWMKYDLAGGNGEPYPLLIIRPDGAQSYALARQAMQSWNDEFGYELVEQEKRIDYGAVDVALANLLQSALTTSRAQYAAIRQLALQTAQPEYADGQRSDGLRVSRDGGFEMIADPVRVTGVANDPQPEPIEPSAETALATDSQQRKTPETAVPDRQVASEKTGELNGSDAIVPLANTRGLNWALPAKNVSTTGYRRPIVVYCNANSLTIEGGGQSTNRQEIEFSFDAESVDRFVNAIWQVIESWGIAERNGFWKPELQFVVDPAGRATFERIQTLLDGCGFDIRRVTLR